ncbi:class I SAM-dependent methyltransferase [Bacillus massiliigorillae]|uniref:class I SAM-dependent methyltransferase n=1 Tax=Bacillus massiliigorillae TaxID=1243664 RepID=UPI00039FC43B|nr:class I SAM-dependent methyltransferase [Bacillus massiliigorillae]
MIVTTAGRTTEEYIAKAKAVANDLQVAYEPRRKKSLQALFKMHTLVVVVGKDGIQLYHQDGSEPYFFHPNLAMVRVKRLMNDSHDAFIEVAGLKQGDALLDCTLGYASDSIVASFVVGETGKVIGVEASHILAYLTKIGLQTWEGQHEEIEKAMRRITVVEGNHYDYLQRMPSKSVDVVYFDPMFEESIDESNALQTLSHFTSFASITDEIIAEARRVARRRIVLKDHFRSTRFEQLGFTQHIRKTAKFHYGTIDL